MNKFGKPEMDILNLEAEDVVRASATCWEIFECLDCYCTEVTCDDVYVCDAQKCPNLSMYD